MTGVWLETPRLVLRQFQAADLDDLVALDADPEVMRFLGGRPTTMEVVRDRVLPHFLAWHAKDPDRGFWAAVDPADGAFLGWFHFRPPHDDVPGVELGYRFRRAVWGRGLATEGARAIVARAFGELGVDRVIAKTMATNVASRRVMEKVGMRYVETFTEHRIDPPAEAVWYAIERADWRP